MPQDPNQPSYLQGIGAIIGSAGVFAKDNIAAPYDYYRIETRYHWNNGTVCLPIAQQDAGGSPLAAAIAQLHSPYGLKIVTWAARRTGDRPVLPDFNPSDENLTLQLADIVFSDPEFTANQVPILQARGTYVYLLKKPISVEDGVFKIGGAPCFELEPDSNTYTSKDFDGDILG